MSTTIINNHHYKQKYETIPYSDYYMFTFFIDSEPKELIRWLNKAPRHDFFIKEDKSRGKMIWRVFLHEKDAAMAKLIWG